MSHENLEVVRAAIEAFNRRDGEGFGALLTGDAEIVPVRTAVDGTVFRGADAGVQYCSAVDETWDDLRFSEGLIASFHTYADRAEALKILGVSE